MHHLCIEVYLRIVGKVVLEDMLNIQRVNSVSVGETSRQIHTHGGSFLQIWHQPVIVAVVVPQNLHKGAQQRPFDGCFLLAPAALHPQIHHHPCHHSNHSCSNQSLHHHMVHVAKLDADIVADGARGGGGSAAADDDDADDFGTTLVGFLFQI